MRSKVQDHVHQIKNKVEVLHRSSRSHALIVESPAGWGKTTAVDEALALAGLKGVHLGSYSTPLNLFRFLQDHSSKIVILDDVAGIFTDRAGMAILKAASWPSPGGRIVTWGSATSRVDISDFEFKGKLIVICNSFPSTADARAIKSRSLTHFFDVTPDIAKTLLQKAARDEKWFSNSKLSRKVADFLCDRLNTSNMDQMSYRTLHIGYDLAEHKPDDWRELLSSMVQIPLTNPKDLIRELASGDLKVNDQVREFERLTGKRRRTFFKYRKELGIMKNGR